MEWFVILLLVEILVNGVYGIIYKLNDTELDRFPPVYRLDNYDKCMNKPGAVYCTVEASLVSDTPNELLATIREYSEHRYKHFNHSYLTYGLCITTTCKNFTNLDLVDQKEYLEGCLNETLTDEYGLKTRVYEEPACVKNGAKFDVEMTDRAVGLLLIGLLFMNIIGTVYDVFSKENHTGSRLLLRFSIRRNWYKLIDTSEKADNISSRLKCLDGIRTILLTFLIASHSTFIIIFNVTNTSVVEESFDNMAMQPIRNTPIAMSCFFLISSVLLSYNLQISNEKENVTRIKILKRMLKRWCRLTPTYAVVFLFIATWFRQLGSGPYWMYIYNSRIEPCRTLGWYNMLYVNNYIDTSMCMIQSWYIAAEMQLHLLGLIVCIFCKGVLRKAVLAGLFIFGLVIPAVLTYIHDLDMDLVSSIELIRRYFLTDPTFRYVYRRSHTNIACYAMGLSLGLILYHLQKKNFDIQKYKQYKPLYYIALIINTGFIFVGAVVYVDGPRLSVSTRVILAAIMKPAAATATALIIFGAVFKFEDRVRGLLEWRGWVVLYRLCYCAYLVHLPLIDYLIGTVNLIRVSYTLMLIIFSGVIVISYLMALMLWLMVESPFAEITDELFKDRHLLAKQCNSKKKVS